MLARFLPLPPALFHARVRSRPSAHRTTAAMAATMPDRALDIVKYWLGDTVMTDGFDFRPSKNAVWFGSALDAEIKANFEGDLLMAEKGELDGWEAPSMAPQAALALIILQDQFTRNMYRGTGRQFDWDAKALATAKRLVGRPGWAAMTGCQRQFGLMPLMHSESLADQEACIAHFTALKADAEAKGDAGAATVAAAASLLGYAVKHRDIVAKFGRFPHRNAMLGRVSTPAEAEHLLTDKGF